MSLILRAVLIMTLVWVAAAGEAVAQEPPGADCADSPQAGAPDDAPDEVTQLVTEYCGEQDARRRVVLRDRLQDFGDRTLMDSLTHAATTAPAVPGQVDRIAELVAWLRLPRAWDVLAPLASRGRCDSVVRAALDCGDPRGVSAVHEWWSGAPIAGDRFGVLHRALLDWHPDAESVKFVVQVASGGGDHANVARELLARWLDQPTDTGLDRLLECWAELRAAWTSDARRLFPEPEPTDAETASERPDLAAHGSLNAHGMPRVVWVRGYTRSDGVHVRGHWRAKPHRAPNDAGGDADPEADQADTSEETHGDGMVWVRPYVRVDGTTVSGHWRQRPDR